MKKILGTIIISFLFVNLNAQIVTIRAYLDTNIIEFANQTVLKIDVKIPEKSTVIFPLFQDTISDGVEIVKEIGIDTISNNPFELEMSYQITSFKDSVRNIVPLPVIINNDTFYSNPLQILVMPLQVDSAFIAKIDTNQTIPIFDIKPPYDAPFTFKEFWLRFGRWILIGILLLGIAILIVWLISRYMKNKPIKLLEKPAIPAHITAFKKLQELKDKKIFGMEHSKEYYSELTEILRTYIELRFRIPALENTTGEIMLNFERTKLLDNELFNSLKMLLTTADMAKFAKYKAQQDINEKNFEMVYNFVDLTKIELKPENTVNLEITEKGNE